MRMSYNGNTSAFQAEARGSIPLIRLILAQAQSRRFLSLIVLFQ